LAAQLAGPLFGLTVNAMTIWRAVQRLGEAAAQHYKFASQWDIR